jgi:DNA-binding transcriptional LysR family regulator
MTFDQIITLDNIVKQGSFKMASEVMHKSQPSLSMAIKKLEEEFSIKLFNRDGYRPILTEEGKSFHKKAQLTIEHFKELENLAIEMGSGQESEINICVDAIFPLNEISETLSDFFKNHKSTSLNLSIDVLEGVMNRLKQHQVDFAIGPDMNLGIEIETIQIIETQLVPVIANKHYSESIGNIDFLKTLPQIVVSSSSKTDNKSVSGSINNQFWYTTDLFTKEQLITSGLGWGRLPLHQVVQKIANNELNIIEGIPQISPKTVSMYLLREKSKTMGPRAKKLWMELSTMKKQPSSIN